MVRRFLFTALACLLALPLAAGPAAPDLSTREGFDRSCQALPEDPGRLRSVQERQAFVVCRDVALVQNVVGFIVNAGRQMSGSRFKLPDHVVSVMLRGRLEHVRSELQTVRGVLETLRLRDGEGLMLKPSQWQVDLDGDGQIQTWECHFFAVPRRRTGTLSLNMPSNDPDYYVREYQLEARFRVDESDVLWALAYHDFAEALVETLLAYRLKDTRFGPESIELTDPPALARALALMVKGFKTSQAMRRAVLAERDDRDEWIANPQQKNTVFPLALDARDFEVWGTLLDHVVPLFEGRTLLAADPSIRGSLLGSAAGLCPPGQGLNIASLYRHPPRHPMQLAQTEGRQAWCETPGSRRPVSGLVPFLEAYAREAGRGDAGAMQFLRHLVWVN